MSTKFNLFTQSQDTVKNCGMSSETKEDAFVHPNKRKIAHTVPSTSHKRYVLDQETLFKQNKFSTLHQDHNYTNASTRDSADAEMFPDEDTQPNRAKIPPIFLHEVNNHQEIVKDIKTHISDDFTTTLKGTSLKINLTNITDYRALTAFYQESGIKYYTFQTNLDKKLEVVLRNVPCSLTDEEIKSELLTFNLPILKVVRLLNKNKTALPLVSVELEKSESSLEVYKIDRLCHAVVSVEPKRKSKEIPQCTRCQRYGHTKNFCNLDPRCVRCTGQHHYSQCPLAKTVPPKCINCGENHTANFKGCKLYQDLKTKVVKSQSKSTGNARDFNAIACADNQTVWPNLSREPANNSKMPNNQLGRPLVSYADMSNSNVPKHLKAPRVASNNVNSNPTIDVTQTDVNPCTKNIEEMILDFFKSIIPKIKTFIISAITSIFNNGSV